MLIKKNLIRERGQFLGHFEVLLASKELRWMWKHKNLLMASNWSFY